MPIQKKKGRKERMKTLYGSTDTNERQQLVGIEPGDDDKGCCTRTVSMIPTRNL